MAQIPLGTFGAQRLTPAPERGRVVTMDPNDVGRGSQAIAGAVANVSMDAINRQNAEDKALARVRASNLILDRENQLKTITADLGEQARLGKLTHDQLAGAYESAIGKLDPLVPTGLDEAETESFGLSLKKLQSNGMQGVQALAQQTRIGEARADLSSRMDILGKDAGMPGSNPEAIIKRMNAEDIDTTGRMAFGVEWDARKQAFADNVYSTHVTQRINAARDNMGELNQLEKDLTEGEGVYASKLDANRRTVALNSVMNFKTRLENKAMAAEAKREAAAMRALALGNQQIASGIPAPAGFWDAIGSKVHGTSIEAEFKDMMHAETEVQEVLRLPPDQQVEFVQQRQVALMTEGGTVKDAANLNRLNTAVANNVKQMQEAPLLFAQARTGTQVQPLDIPSLLASGGDSSVIAAQLQDRASTIQGMRNMYGQGVKMRPLLPQEASALTSTLGQLTPRQQGDIFSLLRQSFGDDATYQGAMQQIAPDSPVKALAGMIHGKQQDITLENNWIADNVTASAGDVAETMLTGENILNKTKADKAADGKSANFPIPKETEFRAEFASQMGKVFAGRPEAFDVAMQAVRSYYTGKSAQEGDITGEVDTKRMRQAIKATIGNPVEVNGGSTVLAPWGMDEDTFYDRAKASFEATMRERGMPDALTNNFGVFSLENRSGDTYRVTQGGDYLRDKEGNPIIINVKGGGQ